MLDQTNKSELNKFSAAAAKGAATEDFDAAATEGAATYVDACSTNGVAAARGVASYYLEASTVADAEDDSDAEYFDRVWAPCSVNVSDASDDDVAAASAKGLTASIQASVVDSAEGPCLAKDISEKFQPRPVRVCFL